MKIAFQMEHLEELTFSSDTSILIANEIQNRGDKIYYYQPKDIIYNAGHFFVKSSRFVVNYEERSFNVIEKFLWNNIRCYDAVFIRQNPPFNLSYLTTTYLLEQIKDVYFVNDPRSIRNLNEKLSILNFPDLIPRTIVVSDLIQAENFLFQESQCVIKSLYDYGGNNIKMISNNLIGKKVLSNMIKNFGFVMMQKFIDRIYCVGDKRVIILDGSIEGVLKRINFKDFRVNSLLGGTGLPAELNNNEIILCNKVGTFLKKENILLAGIDIIDGKLIEINVTSPTCFIAIQKIYNINLAKKIVDLLYKRICY